MRMLTQNQSSGGGRSLTPIFCLCGIVWYSLSLSPQIRAFWLASQVCKDQAGTLAAAVVYEEERC